MGALFRSWSRGAEGYRRFVMQKKLMGDHFPNFSCSYSKRCLTCVGSITPEEGCATYSLKISYVADHSPKVWVMSPKIALNKNIHVYSDGSLCLYYPKETPWQNTDNLHEKILPWTAEWLVYYEIYLMTGVWRGKSAPHPMPRRSGTRSKHSI
ncbi:MAG: hypothetical protein V4675_03495 [Verrucomicrobiota bacterium]